MGEWNDAKFYSPRPTAPSAPVWQCVLCILRVQSSSLPMSRGGYRKGGALLRFCVVSGAEDQVRD